MSSAVRLPFIIRVINLSVPSSDSALKRNVRVQGRAKIIYSFLLFHFTKDETCSSVVHCGVRLSDCSSSAAPGKTEILKSEEPSKVNANVLGTGLF